MSEDLAWAYRDSKVPPPATGLAFRIGVFLVTKRLFDLMMVLLFAPLIIGAIVLLAMLVRVDGGPAFYSQPRLGRNGRVFKLWKLRSMVTDAEHRLMVYLKENPEAQLEWTHAQKLKQDPRVTVIGRYLRKYSLDEIPQLWNVLIGDMSLIGPRPMLPEQKALYPGSAYYYFRPGLTGLWQISKRNQSSFAERADYDTQYAQSLSIASELLIFWRTIAVVIRGTGY